uniref:ATP synthase F0 subunit 8 n=1 Tax=Calyptraea chinensis TaxID=146264 RepID=C8XQL9_9CAEN|nr:ATP synthase F0 subunit 8 [Calyptraea chinensis]
MPQLAPLNWFFLYILFWFIVMLMSILIWWSNLSLFKSNYLYFPGSSKVNWIW